MKSGVHHSLHPNCHHHNAIEKAITYFSWERAFENLSVDEKVSLFNKTIKNKLSNYISYEIITIDEKDPPWFNKNVKSLIAEAWRLHVQCNKNDFFLLKNLLHFKSN